jgi:cytochrome c-type biogenesis protein CcsB
MKKNRLISFLFSMKWMAVLILIFAIAIGIATFIENDFGTPASKAVIYNAKWFEILLLLLVINMTGNIFIYRLYRRSKWPVLLFHVSFILMIVGAGITRFFGSEGLLHIREGNANDKVISDNTYFSFSVDDKKLQYGFKKKLFLNPLYNSGFSSSVDFNGTDIGVEYLDYLPNVKDTIVDDPQGIDFLELVTTDGNGRKSNYIPVGGRINLGRMSIGFGPENTIQLGTDSTGFTFRAPFEASFLKMADQSQGILGADTTHPFENRMLYRIAGEAIVFKQLHTKKKIDYVSTGTKGDGLDLIKVRINVDDETKEVGIKGRKGSVRSTKHVMLGGFNFHLAYGSVYEKLPFTIMLRDFQMERYPGSNSPSSYASEVTLIDKAAEVERPVRIYMNNVLDYKGYRFFQSSYDTDELGTVLSVNKDRPGTLVSYAGYFFLALGFIITLFHPGSRFRKLGELVRKARVKKESLALLALIFTLNINAQDTNQIHIDLDHAYKFGSLQMQDQGGRMKPVSTLASEMLRKIYRKSNYEGLEPEQVMLGMIVQPHYWQGKPMIKVGHEQLRNELGIEGNYATFLDFFDDEFNYVLGSKVDEINRKKPAYRSKYDNELLNVDERVNISYMIYMGRFLRLFPVPGDPNNTWVAPDVMRNNFSGTDSLFVYGILPMYGSAVASSSKSGDWKLADDLVESINQFQIKNGAEVRISESKLKAEQFYNKVDVFGRLFPYYLMVGMLFLIVLFARLFADNRVLKVIQYVLFGLVILGFLMHTGGLALRWYISGHAPWSNGYESMIYIAWATVLSGFIFSRSSQIALAATAVLSSFILMVAHLNWLNPEITNLVPVLNSYWLMIHVAIITASYGFLALGAILGLLNLLLIIFDGGRSKRIVLTVKELTYINEMTLQLGLFMLTIGTFLGGVWANESWGRYWGWDAKETWALASVLFYAFVAHMRLIPGLKGFYAFNLSALAFFSSIIMTYFGVNYYLSGLHSYAAGDPLPIPMFVYYSIAAVVIIGTVAYFRYKKSAFSMSEESA